LMSPLKELSSTTVLAVICAGVSILIFKYFRPSFTNYDDFDEKNHNLAYKYLKKKIKHLKLSSYENSLLNNVICPEMIPTDFSSVGGLSDIKEEIRQLIVLPFLRPDLFNHPLLDIPKGVLLHGPPGTGKTLIAKAIAKESNAVFINFNLAQINQMFLGESEKMLAALFSLARKVQPAIIFIDEVDSFANDRGSPGSFHDSPVHNRLLCMLFSFVDGLTSDGNQITVMCCTNRISGLDPAFLRRMQRKIRVGLPNEEERLHILRLKLKESDAESNFDYERLASITNGYSGSDLENLCKTAAQENLRMSTRDSRNVHKKISMDDFERALTMVPPTSIETLSNQSSNRSGRFPSLPNVNFNHYYTSFNVYTPPTNNAPQT